MTLSADPSKSGSIRLPASLPCDLKKTHLVGRPGMGRGCNTVLEQMILEDLRQGRPVVVLDPRGRLTEETDPDVASPERA